MVCPTCTHFADAETQYDVPNTAEMRTCYNCNGSGKERDPKCEGRGRRNCDSCHGVGFDSNSTIEPRVQCGTCSGAGKIL